jgi:hypothetical protein
MVQHHGDAARPDFSIDLLARIVTIREALEDGDVSYAYDVVRDLENDAASVAMAK